MMIRQDGCTGDCHNMDRTSIIELVKGWSTFFFNSFMYTLRLSETFSTCLHSLEQ